MKHLAVVGSLFLFALSRPALSQEVVPYLGKTALFDGPNIETKILYMVHLANGEESLEPDRFRSKIFYSENGLLVATPGTSWFFIGDRANQNVFVHIKCLSERWKTFCTKYVNWTVYPDPPYHNWNDLLGEPDDQETAALANLLKHLNDTFCRPSEPGLREYLDGLKAVRMAQLINDREVTEQKSRARALGDRYEAKMNLIYYNQRFVLLDSRSRPYAVIEEADILCDGNLFAWYKQMTRNGFYPVRLDAELDPGSVNVLTNPAGQEFGRMRHPEPNFVVANDELKLRGLPTTKQSSIPRGNSAREKTVAGDDSNVAAGGVPIHSLEDLEEGIQYCPQQLGDDRPNELPTAEVYLIDLPQSQTFDEWILVATDRCYKCGDMENDGACLVVSPMLESPLRVRRNDFSNADIDVVADVVGRTVLWRMSELFAVDELSAVGSGGVSFTDRYGKLVLLTAQGSLTVERPYEFDENEFKNWLNLATNGYSLPEAETEILPFIMDMAALSSQKWRQYFRQNPLLFLRQSEDSCRWRSRDWE